MALGSEVKCNFPGFLWNYIWISMLVEGVMSSNSSDTQIGMIVGLTVGGLLCLAFLVACCAVVCLRAGRAFSSGASIANGSFLIYPMHPSENVVFRTESSQHVDILREDVSPSATFIRHESVNPSYSHIRSEDVSLSPTFISREDVSSSYSHIRREDVSPSPTFIRREDVSSSYSDIRREDVSPSPTFIRREDVSSSYSDIRREDVSPSLTFIRREDVSSSYSDIRREDARPSPAFIRREDVRPLHSHLRRENVTPPPSYREAMRGKGSNRNS